LHFVQCLTLQQGNYHIRSLRKLPPKNPSQPPVWYWGYITMPLPITNHLTNLLYEASKPVTPNKWN
jgi:hypothetical protein